jgi:1-hydroxycarotenoid 3,4-desaturase
MWHDAQHSLLALTPAQRATEGRPMRLNRVVVIGAGIGGLAAAADLARHGAAVTLVERADAPGGKLRQLVVADPGGPPATVAATADGLGGVNALGIDAGPTVFTMRWVFESLFADAGQSLSAQLDLVPAVTLARHAWRGGGQLDLFADRQRSADAIGQFAGAADARGYLAFCDRAAEVYRTLQHSFMAAPRPSPLGLVRRLGLRGLPALWRTAPLCSLWQALGRHFSDPRLRQLFARYATYVGSSPWLAPATLMLIAHVEQDGVWLVRGGMHQLALALQRLGQAQGVCHRYGCGVRQIVVENGRAAGVLLHNGERLAADAVVFNGDAQALASGLLGDGARHAAAPTPRAQRSLSAITWCVRAPSHGLLPAHHNVFFADDYRAEFDALFKHRRISAAPTVYVCAQDRGEHAPQPPAPGAAERLLVLINAPADGDQAGRFTPDALALHQQQAWAVMRACGFDVDLARGSAVVTSPVGFDALFPATGGALYGRANHGAMASFKRPGAASALPGLYLAGGSSHPGAGMPMAALSGRLAAAQWLADQQRR